MARSVGRADVHFGGPGVPSLAVSWRHEGYWQGQVPEFPCDPDRPLQWHGRELGPVLGCIEVRSVTSCLGGPLLHPLRHRQQLSLLGGCHGASRKQVSSSSRPPPRGAAKPRARGPRTGRPEMVGTALQEMVTAPLLPSEESRVVSSFFFLFCCFRYPYFQSKSGFLSSPGPKRAWRVVGGAKPHHSHPPLLSPADISAQFEKVTKASPAPPIHYRQALLHCILENRI